MESNRRSRPRRAVRAVAALATALLVGGIAEAAPVSCTGGAAAVPQLDPLASSAELGAYTLDCGGGLPADPALTVNIALFLGAALLDSMTPLLSAGSTSYVGTIVSPNQVSFSAVSIDPVASSFAVEQLFVDPSLYGAGFVYTALLSISGATPVALSDPAQVLGVNGSLAVPEPASGWLLVAAGLAWFGMRRRL